MGGAQLMNPLWECGFGHQIIMLKSSVLRGSPATFWSEMGWPRGGCTIEPGVLGNFSSPPTRDHLPRSDTD
eukprot:4226877-Amphidinium_carterae.3